MVDVVRFGNDNYKKCCGNCKWYQKCNYKCTNPKQSSIFKGYVYLNFSVPNTYTKIKENKPYQKQISTPRPREWFKILNYNRNRRY